jgi:hypothetical protein
MNDSSAILKWLITYAVIVPLALFIGYLLTNPLDYSTFAYVGVLGFVLVFPLLLRWHYWLLLFSLNASMVVFFLKGSPNLWLVTVVLSLGISVLERALSSEKRFIGVPQVTWPLVCLVGVVLFTAKMTGGFGLRMLGSEVYGGRKYIFVLCAIMSYFALTAHRIPRHQAKWAVALFFLGGMTYFIGDLYGMLPSAFNFIFLFFPPSSRYDTGFDQGIYRLGGTAVASTAIICYLLARYGIRGIFLSGKRWRLAVFILFFSLTLLSGYRSTLVGLGLILVIQFFLEGLHRTKLLPIFAVMGVFAMVVMIPLTPKLPYTVQRTLSFLPLLPVDPTARQDGQNTMQWRYDLWTSLLPMVPKHLLLGKGYAITAEDFEMMGSDVSFKATDPSQQGLALATDYHNGWLSVIIPFGIWGMLAFLGFLFAAGRVLYANYRYSDPALQLVNAILLAMFLKSGLLFFGGALSSDMMTFASLVGFSVSLNGGVRQPAVEPVQKKEPLRPARIFPRTHPAFQR